jgi:hypothetical protein
VRRAARDSAAHAASAPEATARHAAPGLIAALLFIVAGPVPNTLVVRLSQPDGTYVIGNPRLFGTDIVDIGRLSTGLTVGEFNGDARPDVGISVCKEGMRACGRVGLVNRLTPQVVLLSKADGSYSVECFTVVANAPNPQAVDNEVGGVDFIQVNHDGGTGRRQVDERRLAGRTGLPAGNTAMTFRPGSRSGQGLSKVLSTSLDPADGTASLQIRARRSGEWIGTSTYVTPSRRIEAISRHEERTQPWLAAVNGIRMPDATFEEACVMRISPTGRDDIVPARIGGFVTLPDRNGTSLLDER